MWVSLKVSGWVYVANSLNSYQRMNYCSWSPMGKWIHVCTASRNLLLRRSSEGNRLALVNLCRTTRFRLIQACWRWPRNVDSKLWDFGTLRQTNGHFLSETVIVVSARSENWLSVIQLAIALSCRGHRGMMCDKISLSCWSGVNVNNLHLSSSDAETITGMKDKVDVYQTSRDSALVYPFHNATWSRSTDQQRYSWRLKMT